MPQPQHAQQNLVAAVLLAIELYAHALYPPMHYLMDWSHLPGPALEAVLAQLGLALACDEPLYVFHAKVPAPNKYWAQACKEVSPQLVLMMQPPCATLT